MDAEWKDIPGFEGLYQAHSNGQIRSLDRTVPRRTGGTRKYYGQLMTQYLRRSGYMDVKLCREGKQYIFLSHRVVAMTFIPNPDSLPVIDHINGCRSDNRINNLEWVTTLENNRRLWRADHGNNPRAEKAKRFRCPIKATNHDTGETLILRGTAEIRAAGFNSHNVTSCLQGNRNTCKGFSFVRLE